MKKFALFLLTSLLLLSCSDNDNVVNIQTKPVSAVEPNDSVCVLSYDRFITDNDVTILNSDTSKISISKAMLNKNGINITSDNILAIWTSKNDYAFVRDVTKVEDFGEKLVVTTEPADISRVFKNVNRELSTTLYYDESKDEEAGTNTDKNTAGDTYDEYDVSDTIHPAVIAVQNDTGGYTGKDAEEILKEEHSTRISVDKKWTFIDLNKSINFAFPLESGDEDVDTCYKEGYVKVGIDDGYFKLKSDFVFQLETSWFSLKELKAEVVGSLDTSLPITVSIGKEWVYEYQKTLYEFNRKIVTFWVGIVPVSFVIDPSIQARANVNGNGRIFFKFPYEYHTSFTTGLEYNDGWNFISEHKNDENKNGFMSPSVGGEVSVEASLGVYFHLSTLLYGLTGPGVSVGLAAKTVNSATLVKENEKPTIKLKSTGSVDVCGDVGWKFKFLWFAEKYYKQDFTIYSFPLWNKTLDLNLGQTSVKPNTATEPYSIPYKDMNMQKINN